MKQENLLIKLKTTMKKQIPIYQVIALALVLALVPVLPQADPLLHKVHKVHKVEEMVVNGIIKISQNKWDFYQDYLVLLV